MSVQTVLPPGELTEYLFSGIGDTTVKYELKAKGFPSLEVKHCGDTPDEVMVRVKEMLGLWNEFTSGAPLTVASSSRKKAPEPAPAAASVELSQPAVAEGELAAAEPAAAQPAVARMSTKRAEKQVATELNIEAVEWLNILSLVIPEYADKTPFDICKLWKCDNEMATMSISELRGVIQKAQDDIHVYANGKGHEDAMIFLLVYKDLKAATSLDELEAAKAKVTQENMAILAKNQPLIKEVKRYYEARKRLYETSALLTKGA